MSERTVTLKGDPLPVYGKPLNKGDKAPNFKLHQRSAKGMKDVSLDDYRGKVLILSVVPSLDTPVCATQTKRFNQEAANLPEDICVLTVSTDLPFAQARFCGDNGINKIETASDHRDTSFGEAYGTLIPPLRILARSLFVVGKDGTIRHVEYVPEIGNEPDYDAALKAAHSAR